jgi:hypothetical protein
LDRAGMKVSIAGILNFMKFEGTFGHIWAEMKYRLATAEVARKAGLRIRTVELQKAADLFRLQRGLFRASDTEEWLDSNGLTHQDFESYLEVNLLIRKLIRVLEKRGNDKQLPWTGEVKKLVRDKEYERWLRRAAE